MLADIARIVLPLAAEVLLLCCGAFFASTETAYTALSRIAVRQMLKDNAPHAKEVGALRDKLDRLISTVLIGTNFITTLSSSLATAYALAVFGSSAVSSATAVMSVLIIIFSEIIPKTYASAHPQQTAGNSARPIIVIQKILFPLVWIFDHLSAFIEFIERKLIRHKPPLITEEELKTLIDVGGTEGTLQESEKKMLSRIFEFSDLHVRDIMKHRAIVKYVYDTDSVDTVIRAFAESGYSRLPVCKGSPETVVGVLHYKAVLFADNAITQSKDFIRICMRPVQFIPETLTAVELLQHFKKDKNNFAVVVDEYGGTAGIVTMDDILREGFGRTTDEYGMTELPPEKRITVISTAEFLVPGDMKLDDLNDVLKMSLYSENFDTLGGWLLERFGELPSTGEAYREDGVIFVVEDQSARRIQSVRIRFSHAAEQQGF